MTSYGFAAFNGGSCGDCYELDFTGQSNNGGKPDPGSASLCGKKMIVQVVNIGNLNPGQFDLMIPGGGVGQFQGGCPAEWQLPATSPLLGDVNGGLLLTCQNQNVNNYQAQLTCTKNMCASLFTSSNQSELLKGCDWMVDWFGGAANPSVKYTKLSSCPSQLTSISMLK